MYWEKVQPLGAPAFNPLVSMFPLMKNWTEVEGKKRDDSDVQYGRGKGNVNIFFFFIFVSAAHV
jgi:hypothetical protein